MIRKILIANRGEIACRIIQTCRAMGIATVAVYSDADANALHVQQADEAVHVGAAPAAASYLAIETIVTAAHRTEADAVHPGYGFLAENADFARAIIDAGMIFIGPSPDVIAAMGKKREAKQVLVDVPVVPGYAGTEQSDKAFIEKAETVGYPIMLKSSAGGGGKGMRRVDNAQDLPEALQSARREARQAFGDDTLILERFLYNPRHIEVQILGDKHGNVIALGERECSIQRRYQKLIEESPAPGLSVTIRTAMTAASVRIGQQLNYTSAGTVEFLLDADQNFYFMEMNTRLQVEHPVTELVFGEDLVRWQILIAEGRAIDEIASRAIESSGHAVEARIYAEDPDNDFLPATGTVLHMEFPEIEGVRFDNGIHMGEAITTYYDPLLAKVIAYGETRSEALRRLDYALSRLVLLGARHNANFLRRVIVHDDFTSGNIHTAFIEAHGELRSRDELPSSAVIAAALARYLKTSSGTEWRNNRYDAVKNVFSFHEESIEVRILPGKKPRRYSVRLTDTTDDVQVFEYSANTLFFAINGHQQRAAVAWDDDVLWVHLSWRTYRLEWQPPLPLPSQRALATGSLRAPMPGQIASVRVIVGQQVTRGDTLITLEAMKMEHRVVAPYDGIVRQIHYNTGDTVPVDANLLEVEPTTSPG